MTEFSDTDLTFLKDPPRKTCTLSNSENFTFPLKSVLSIFLNFAKKGHRNEKIKPENVKIVVREC